MILQSRFSTSAVLPLLWSGMVRSFFGFEWVRVGTKIQVEVGVVGIWVRLIIK